MMGKSYDHEYFFSGSGSLKGSMVCRACNNPIFNHNQDWMVYKKNKSYDWAYYCFHRKCSDNQSGWLKFEKALQRKKDKAVKLNYAINNLCKDFNLSIDDLISFLKEPTDD